ncbi:MAG: cytochrome c [Lentimicrobiaceae bacterium]|jgi:nitrite reductase (NO-forming)
MKTRNFIAIAMASLFGLAMITSCGGGKTGDKSTSDSTKVSEQPAQPAAPSAEQMAMGKKIYETPAKCITCHQADGKGVKGAFPPLAGSDYLLADKKRAVAQVLNGSHHAIVVNGDTYTGEMLQQVGTHEEAVAVINYVLNNFGNNGGYITVDEVKDIVIDPRK